MSDNTAPSNQSAGEGAGPNDGPGAGKGRKLNGGAKMAVDMGPLAVFMLAYFLGPRLAGPAGDMIGRDWSVAEGREMFFAIALFLPAYCAAFAYSVWKERRIAPMLFVSGVIVGVLGGLTLLLDNKVFFFMKPTIAYLLFTMALGGGLIAKRNFLKILFDGALHMPDPAWRTLTVRYAIFFGVLAVLNEIAWRTLTRDCDLFAETACAGEKIWVQLDVFGFTIVILGFTMLQAAFIARHMIEEEEAES